MTGWVLNILPVWCDPSLNRASVHLTKQGTPEYLSQIDPGTSAGKIYCVGRITDLERT